jgi:hypothetical protein
VSPEAALDKMRLLALLALGGRPGGLVSFGDIQAGLDIPCDQVNRGGGAPGCGG